MKDRSQVIREVKVHFHTCPSPLVPIWLLQLYEEAGLLIVLFMVNYSNGYGFPADERVQTTTVGGGSEVRGHALVHQHTIKHTRQGWQMQHVTGVSMEEMTSPHQAGREDESNSDVKVTMTENCLTSSSLYIIMNTWWNHHFIQITKMKHSPTNTWGIQSSRFWI